MGTKIEWTHIPGTKGETWNPIRARNRENGKVGHFCEKVSPGCKNCYASTWNARGMDVSGNGLVYITENRDKAEFFLDEKRLLEPLSWRKPRSVFLESMSDLFGSWVPDEWIDRIFAVMALCPQHTFIMLTKRASRMREYLASDATAGRVIRLLTRIAHGIDGASVNLTYHEDSLPGLRIPNVWLGVSVEDQQRADERIPELLGTPAAVRFVSYEPALGPVDFTKLNLYPWLDSYRVTPRKDPGSPHWPPMFANALTGETSMPFEQDMPSRIDWLIIGGESGPGARPFGVPWAEQAIRDCREAGVACFVKQLGAKPYEMVPTGEIPPAWSGDGPVHAPKYLSCPDKKGGKWDQWPEHLRVREWPAVVAAAAPATDGE